MGDRYRLQPGIRRPEKKVDSSLPVVYPNPFPCRIDENNRTVHCNSCEMVPTYLNMIRQLEEQLKMYERGELRPIHGN